MPDNATVATSKSQDRDGLPPERTGNDWKLAPQQVLVIFAVSGESAAFPIQNVARIAPMARLYRPPGLPSMLEGVLNLAGRAVPVVRLDRLFQLKEQHPGLYSMLIVMKGVADDPLAVLVDRVDGMATVALNDVLPLREQNSFNGCAEGTVRLREQVIHLLSPSRILLVAEREALHEFQEMAQRRLKGWDFDKS